MKLIIKDYCIRCGLCVDLYPELFELNFKDDCLAVKYDEIPDELVEKAQNAIKDCSITAIHTR